MRSSIPDGHSCPPCVVIDACVFVSDYWMRGASWAVMKSLLERAPVRLHIPSLVVSEVKNKYEEHLRTAQQKYDTAFQALQKLSNTGEVLGDLEGRLREATDRFSVALDSTLSAMSAEISDYPDTPHQLLVERDLRRQKPFSEGGKGYRDALIWETILHLAREGKAPIAFITTNSQDFALEGALHPHLRADLDRNSLDRATVELYTLTDFVDLCARPLLERLDREDERTDEARAERLKAIESELATGRFKGESLDEKVSLAIQDRFQGQDFVGSEMGFPSEFETMNFDWVHNIVSYAPQEVDFLSRNEVFAEVTVEAEFEFEACVYRADVPLLDEEYFDQLRDFDWDDYYARVSGMTVVTVDLRLVLDDESGDVRGIDVADMYPVERF